MSLIIFLGRLTFLNLNNFLIVCCNIVLMYDYVGFSNVDQVVRMSQVSEMEQLGCKFDEVWELVNQKAKDKHEEGQRRKARPVS